MPVLLSVLLSGCDPLGDSGGGATAPATVAGGVDGGRSAGGCGQPGERVRHWLPVFDRSSEREASIEPVTTNPCVPFADLASTVGDFIPEGERKVGSAALEFVEGVRGMADKFLTAANEAECLYEADRLAVGIYHHSDYPWSVAVVVVLRGRAGLVLDTVSCYAIGRPAPGDIFRSEGNRPRFAFCPDVEERNSSGEPFTILRVGSSNWMCDALRHAIPAD